MAAGIEIMPEDLTGYAWDGRPIRLLVVDSLKRSALARAFILHKPDRKEACLYIKSLNTVMLPWFRFIGIGLGKLFV